LLDPARGKRGLRLRLCFIWRVGEFRVNGFCDAYRVIWTVDPQNVPANLPFDCLRDALFEVIPLKPELGFVILRTLAVINAVENEFPGAASV